MDYHGCEPPLWKIVRARAKSGEQGLRHVGESEFCSHPHGRGRAVGTAGTLPIEAKKGILTNAQVPFSIEEIHTRQIEL